MVEICAWGLKKVKAARRTGWVRWKGGRKQLPVKYVNYAFRFSGPVTALRAGARAKSKIDYNKLLPTGDISHGLLDTTVSN